MIQPARFTARAQRELLQALQRMDHASAAERLRHLVADAARSLGRHPDLGRQEPTLADARYRFWSVPDFPYLLVYRTDMSPPSIIRFVHAARDLPVLLAGLRASKGA